MLRLVLGYIVFGCTTRSDEKILHPGVSIRNAACTPSTTDSTGAISSGYIILSGLLLRSKVYLGSDGSQERPYFSIGDITEPWCPDSLPEDWIGGSSTNKAIYCLKIEEISQQLA